jgi:hypothetical protein
VTPTAGSGGGGGGWRGGVLLEAESWLSRKRQKAVCGHVHCAAEGHEEAHGSVGGRQVPARDE